jgi:hypothetical protein
MRAVRLFQLLVSLLVLAAFLASLPTWAAPAAQKSTLVHKLKIIIRTGEDWGAGTDDPVWFSLGPSYEWPLVASGTPFKSGASTTFNLGPQGLNVEDIKFVRVRKGRDGGGGRWLLQGIEVWVNGRPLYRKPDIDTWLDNAQLEWTATDYPVRR